MKSTYHHLSLSLMLCITIGFILSPLQAKENASTILTQTSDAMNQIAQKASPAVVSISSVKSIDATPRIDPSSDYLDHKMLGIGSGVLIRSDGLILTNYHVVENADRVTVSIDEKTKVKAHIIGGDSKTDLAILQIPASYTKSLSILSFGDSDQIKVGDWTLAVGSPFGLSHSVTLGIVSAVGRAQLGMLDIEDFIQTDAAINPGNSGGPLLNSKGEMIGVNTAIFSQTGGFIGIGFSIPSRIAKQVVEDILKHGHVVRGWIGMAAQDLDNDLAQYFHVPLNQGALVSHVQPDGPAARAALEAGDVIMKFADIKVTSSGQLKALVAKIRTASQVPIEISRDGKIKNLIIAVNEQPQPKRKNMAGTAAKNQKDLRPYLGVSVQDIPLEFTKVFGISSKAGALVTHVKTGSPAFDAGLASGDIILSANKVPVRGAEDFAQFIKQFKNHAHMAVLYVQRGPEEKLYISIKPLMS